MKLKKISNYFLGLGVEFLASLFLRIKGYQIICRRFRSHNGEIDLIALDGLTIVFIEVKYRSQKESALESLSQTQQHRIFRASQDFFIMCAHMRNRTYRYDFLVFSQFYFQHFRNAWQIDEFVT